MQIIKRHIGSFRTPDGKHIGRGYRRIRSRFVPGVATLLRRVPARRVNSQLLLALLTATLTACTHAAIHYRSTEGYVQIRPDMSVHTLPAQTYYFYHTDGSTKYLVSDCDGDGNFKGVLPVGTYHVIAGNARTSCADYRGMESYETATVHAGNLTNYLPGRSPMFSSPRASGSRSDVDVLDDIYRVVLKDMTVAPDDTLLLKPLPSLLTRTVTLHFGLDEQLQQQVTALTGILPGVYPSVHLFSGHTSDEAIAHSPGLQVGYAAKRNSDWWLASINVFGLCDPQYGENYRSVTVVSLVTPVETIQVSIDLTHEVSHFMTQYGGDIPLNIPLELNVELEWNGIEVKGSVKPWQDGGSTEVEN